MGLYETDSVYDDTSFHNASFDIVPSGCVDNSTNCDDEDGCEIRSEIERFELLAKKVTKFSPEWFELKEELVELNVLLNSHAKEVDHQQTKPLEACVSNPSNQRLLSHKNLNKVFLTPIYFSALLVAMAHEPSKRGARFCGTYIGSDCEEVENAMLIMMLIKIILMVMQNQLILVMCINIMKWTIKEVIHV